MSQSETPTEPAKGYTEFQITDPSQRKGAKRLPPITSGDAPTYLVWNESEQVWQDHSGQSPRE